MHEPPEPRRRGALCGGERRQRPSQLWQREHGRVVLDQSMKIRLDGVEVAVRLERRGEVPREAPHELDARRVVGAAAQERDLGVEGRGAERTEVRSNLCGNQPVRRVSTPSSRRRVDGVEDERTVRF